MTERAQRAAAELLRHGWMMDSEGLRPCLACGHEHASLEARYCQQCGTPVSHIVSRDHLAELEAAIAAAVDGGKA